MDVERWTAAAVPWWVTRLALACGWLVALVVAIDADNGTCVPATPCAPDVMFAFAVVLLLATPVLLWVMPVTGCLAGIGFAVADLLFDDLAAANFAFGLHGLACAVAMVWILRSRAEQTHIAARDFVRLPGRPPLGLAPALICVVAGILAFLQYDVAAGEISAHVAAAARVDAQVVEVRDVSVVLELPDRQRVEVDPLVVGQYRIGDHVPVLADGPWVRLVAEPEDPTWWLTLGFGLLCLASLFVVRGWQRRLLWSRPVPSLPVMVEALEPHRVLLRVAGRPLAQVRVGAQLPVVPPYSDSSHFGRVWRGEERPPSGLGQRATVAGELHLGGRVVLIADGEVLQSAVLRPVRRRADLPGRPVPVGAVPASLPYVVRSPGRGEGVLFLAAAAVLLAAPRFGLPWVALVIGAQCVVAAWHRLFSQVRLEHTALVLNAGLFTYRVPWTALHGVRRFGRRLALAFGPTGDVITTPPLDPGGLGEQMMGLRARALLTSGGAHVTRTLSLAPLLAGAYLVVGLLILGA